MDARLAGSGWLGGPEFSIADCSAAPALWYANTLQRVDESTPHLLAYFRRLLERPSFKAALDEARPWFKYYPYAEAIPAEFL
jgi:glutathione S-transferase